MRTKLVKIRQVTYIYKEKLCGLAVPTHRVLLLGETCVPMKCLLHLLTNVGLLRALCS